MRSEHRQLCILYLVSLFPAVLLGPLSANICQGIRSTLLGRNKRQTQRAHACLFDGSAYKYSMRLLPRQYLTSSEHSVSSASGVRQPRGRSSRSTIVCRASSRVLQYVRSICNNRRKYGTYSVSDLFLRPLCLLPFNFRNRHHQNEFPYYGVVKIAAKMKHRPRHRNLP